MKARAIRKLGQHAYETGPLLSEDQSLGLSVLNTCLLRASSWLTFHFVESVIESVMPCLLVRDLRVILASRDVLIAQSDG